MGKRFDRRYNEMTDDERSENNFQTGCAMLVILIVVGPIMYLLKGREGLRHWLK